MPKFGGSLSLFPTRPFPLEIYYNETEEHSIRYEANNRSERDLEAPNLPWSVATEAP